MLFDRGESWKAVSFEPIEPGQSAEVVSISGLTLRVQPKPGPKEIES
jgi:membrane-bound ClpP family serine protease